MSTDTRETVAFFVGATAAVLMLPACFVSPALVLGTATVAGVSLFFKGSNR
jgi:hypothetical protein